MIVQNPHLLNDGLEKICKHSMYSIVAQIQQRVLDLSCVTKELILHSK